MRGWFFPPFFPGRRPRPPHSRPASFGRTLFSPLSFTIPRHGSFSGSVPGGPSRANFLLDNRLHPLTTKPFSLPDCTGWPPWFAFGLRFPIRSPYYFPSKADHRLMSLNKFFCRLRDLSEGRGSTLFPGLSLQLHSSPFFLTSLLVQAFPPLGGSIFFFPPVTSPVFEAVITFFFFPASALQSPGARRP